MPWKINSIVGERWAFIESLLRGEKSLSSLCHLFGVSRRTAYKWKRRFTLEGRRGLRDRSRRPLRMPRQLKAQWIHRIKQARRKHPHWGAKKIHAGFQRQGWGGPAVRTIAQWLKRLGLTRPGRRRTRRAGVQLYRALTLPEKPNQVWTVDFKGWFRAGNGQRVEPLTVRDLFSRYGLLARLLADQRWTRAKGAFTRLFRDKGMPEIIRVDNGGPFASAGPAGLSRLSAWWVRLGMEVQFTRPGHPQDNGAHEQFHRVMKKETTGPAAYTPRGQQHRTTVWLRGYNEVRPHEALGQKVPAQWYRKSQRLFPKQLSALKYPAGHSVRQVRSNGEIRWAGRKRFIGEAFVGQTLGLCPIDQGVAAVFFSKLLLGHLHQSDPGAMRPILYRHWRRT